MKDLTTELIKEVYEDKHYPFFTGAWNVNIGGIRNDDLSVVDEFNDILWLAWEDDFGRDNLLIHRGTTKPGLYWLKNKMGNMNGTAILAEGYYFSCWTQGLHKGQYKALVQSDKAKFLVYRDNDRDGKFDISGKLYDDVSGLNGHTTSFINDKDRVGAYSAGCQVREDDKDHIAAMAIIEKSMERYGKYVSYGLTNFSDFH